MERGKDNSVIRLRANTMPIIQMDLMVRDDSAPYWELVALSDYIGIRCRAQWHGPDSPMRLGFAFKLDRSDYDLHPERRRPRSMVHAYTFKNKAQYYWDPEKWEEDWKKQQKR
jgi:hypothetical protein